MSKLLIYTVFFLFSILSIAQHKDKLYLNDIQRLNFKSNLKMVTHKRFYNISQKDSAHKLKHNDFFGVENYTLFFDKKGYIYKKIELGSSGDSLKKIATIEYFYDNQNRIIKEERYRAEYPKDTTTLTYEYFRDSITNIKADYKYANSRFIYIQNGNKETFLKVGKDSTIQQKTIYFYDKYYRKLRKESYDPKTNELIFLESKNYKDSITTEPSTTLRLRTKYSSNINLLNYDINDKGYQEKIFNSNCEPIRHINYTYDKNENWVEKKIYSPNGALLEVLTREYEYY